MGNLDDEIDKALATLVAAGVDISNTSPVRRALGDVINAQVNHDADNSTLPLKLGSRMSKKK